MAENKYRKYLNSDEEHSRFSFSELLGKTVTAAGILTGAAGAYKGLKYLNSKGEFDEIKKDVVRGMSFLSKKATLAEGYMTGLNATIKQSGLLRTITGEADEALEANLRKTLTPGIIGEMGSLEGTPTRFVKQLYESSLAKRETAKSVIQNVRLDKVLGEFRTRVGNDDVYNAFDDLLRTKGSVLKAGWGSKGNRNKIISDALNNAISELQLDAKFKGNVDFTSARVELTNLLSKHGNKQKFVQENRDVIKGQLSAINKAFDDAMIADLKRPDSTSDAIISKTFGFGFRRLTVGEAVKNQALHSAIPFKEVIIKNASKYGTNLGREGIDPHNMALRALQRNPSLADAPVDPLVFINDAGNLMDLRWMRRVKDKTLKSLSNNIQVPFIGIRPFKLLSIVNKESIDNMPKFNIFRRGTIMPSINNSLERLKEDYYYFSGRLIDKSGNVVEEDGYLPSAHFGIPQRVASAMAGISKRTPKEPEGFWGHVGKLFDIGNQEFESDISRKASVVTKWFDPNYGRNLWRTVTKPGSLASVSDENLQQAYTNFMNVVDNNSSALDRDTLVALKGYLEPVVGQDVVDQLINEPQAEGTMNAIYKLLARSDAKDPSLGPLRNKDALKRTLDKYINNPDAFDRPVRTVKKGYHIPIESIDATNTELVSSLDEAQKLLHTEILNLVQIRNSVQAGKTYTVGDMAKELLETGKITGGQADSIRDLHLLGEMRGFADSEGNLTKKGVEGFSNLVQNNSAKSTHEHLRDTIFKANPILGEGPGEKPENAFTGNDLMFMRRARNPVKVVNEVIKQGGNIDDIIGAIAETTVGQLGFGPASIRAGRGNLKAVTTATQAAYYYAFRLNEGLSKVGIGLGREHLGSTQSILSNLFMRRLLGPAAVVAGLGYLNYESGNVIGEKPSQLGAEAYARMSLDVAWVKDITGINAMSKFLGRVMPGSDKLWQNPIGMAMKFGTFGLLGEDRSYGELKNYYEKGYEPIRKGRYWSWGSSTPFYGGRVEYFAPSWYRQVMGQPMMTDVMYGSESEYWGNHWLPNPRNPLGILKSFINPYHWEDKHRLDRPYPVTGGIQPLEEMPLVGPLFSGTIGNIIKPPRQYQGLAKAHREYLREINNKYKEYAGQGAGGAMLLVSPGGRITPVTATTGTEYYAETDAGDGGYGGYAPGLPGAVSAGVPGEGGVRVVDPTGGFRQQAGSYINSAQLTAINKGIIDKAYLKPIDTRSIQQLRDNVFVDSLDEAMDPNSPAYRLSETWYSMTEIGGIYGFAANSMFGEMAPGTILQSSSRMTSMSRAFWDERLGGMGGELSEIYRRFAPNWRNSIKQYNPIRNTMPDWMPGVEYFTDFKHGDPYVKIPKGEMRLPGAGYEAINKLHPDFFGQYGALDRLKILGDIAPWSEQYQYYNRVASKMYQAGMMSEEDYAEAQEARDRVRERKKKYDLYPYKFRYADVINKTVTVTQWVDSQTFLTKEMPGTPIRMAGIKVTNADTPEGEEARTAIREHIKPGQKVRIGIDKDPLNRMRDDIVGSMPAVIYDKYGGPLQARLVRANIKGITANYDDSSAVATNSLYENNMITVGKVWEAFAHMDTPFHTKFLQIRSPLEHYKRQLLYGKEWQSWSHPIRDWVGPTIDKLSSQNPVYASVMGAGIGWLFGVWGRSKKAGALIGALIGGISSSITVGKEVVNRTVGMNPEYTWIPKRRVLERDIDEYFDMLKYAKYRGLYEKTRQLAIRQEGIDPEDIIKYAESKSEQTSKNRRYIENVKKWLKIGRGTGMIDEEEGKATYQDYNNKLTTIAGDNLLVEAGPLALKALQYRQEYQSTLYGADPNGDMTTIYRALPKKDRPFFKEFMLASPEEREEILRIVPKNQRRFYQAKWGLVADRQESIGEYFKNHRLPGADWAGWRPDVSLEEVKLKFVNSESLEIGEFGFWEDDLKYAKNAPQISDIKKNGLNALDVAQLHKVLNGMGIRNADILVTTEVVETPDNLFGVDVDLMHDRREDALSAINDNLATLLAE